MNDKLMYVLELSAKQHKAILEALKENESPEAVKQSLLHNNALTGIQGPRMRKYAVEGFYEVYTALFWTWYNMFKYPKIKVDNENY